METIYVGRCVISVLEWMDKEDEWTQNVTLTLYLFDYLFNLNMKLFIIITIYKPFPFVKTEVLKTRIVTNTLRMLVASLKVNQYDSLNACRYIRICVTRLISKWFT